MDRRTTEIPHVELKSNFDVFPPTFYKKNHWKFTCVFYYTTDI